MIQKRFKEANLDQQFLLPLDLRDWLDDDDFTWYIQDLVDHLDLSPVYNHYERELRGQPPEHPEKMVRVILLGYATGATSTRSLERACKQDIRFRVLACNTAPDHSTFARFMNTHRDFLTTVFTQIVHKAQHDGMIHGARVVVDGTKIRANANLKQTRTVEQWQAEHDKIRDEIDAWFDQIEQQDEQDHEAYGEDNPLGRLPPELRDKHKRKQRIREVLNELQDTPNEEDADPSSTTTPTINPKRKINLTDPDSRRMREGFHKQRGGTPVQAYNCQACVDAETGLAVAFEISQSHNDMSQAPRMLENTRDQLGAYPAWFAGDAGYYKHDVFDRFPQEVTAVIPPPRVNKGPSDKAQRRVEMAKRARTEEGKRLMQARKETVEPVFGHIKHNRGTRQFLRRGKQSVKMEWSLVLAGSNLVRMWRNAMRKRPDDASFIL